MSPSDRTRRTLHVDPVSGASGDMLLGALIDAGLPLGDLTRSLGALGISGFTIRAEPAEQHGIHGTRVTVETTDDAHSRTWATIRQILDDSRLEPSVREMAIRVFQRLANAEARIHGTTPDEIHFHEVGGIDAIVDICGACIGFHLLGVEQITCGPLPTGSGYAKSAHGTIPVPAPATLELIAEAGAPIAAPAPFMAETPAELLTPTGAAILTTLATFGQPSIVPSSIGYGFGTRELPWPNALRVWLGTADSPEVGGEVLLEANVDDMNPQFVEIALERMTEAGALEVWTTPASMKKQRPAFVLSAIAPASRRASVEAAMIEQTTTLGVRAIPLDRTKAARAVQSVTTRFGDVDLKLRIWNGRVIDIAPEYDDCARFARQHDVPVRTVWNEAYRLGEALIGTRRGSS